jgi:acyl transferase domain-containing protein
MSGSYAHAVVEEFTAPERAARKAARGPVAVVLSARDGERLRESAGRLAAALAAGDWDDADLPDIARTLRAREAMTERMAAAVGSVAELVEVLRAFASSRTDARVLGTAAGAFGGLLAEWVAGAEPDVGGPGEKDARLVTLPTYPFARERFWLPGADAPAADGAPRLHPLLHRAVDGVPGRTFTTVFDGGEYVLAQHRVAGRPVLPGVAYLEMAREAAVRADGTAVARLENVAWLRPLEVADGPAGVETCLAPAEGDSAGFTVTGPGGVVHCRGTVLLGTPDPDGGERVDLETVRGSCAGPGLSPERVYAAYRAAGIDYGPAMRGLRSLEGGPGGVLARVEVPGAAREDGAPDTAYALHPALLDSALQAALGLLAEPESAAGPALPFSVDEVELHQPCGPAGWAWLRPSAHRPDGTRVFDLDLFDDDGVVRVRLRGACARELAPPPGQADDEGPDLCEPAAGGVGNGLPAAVLDAAPEPIGPADPGWHPETITAVPLWDGVPPGPEGPAAGRTLVLGGDPRSRAAAAAALRAAEPVELPAEASADQLARVVAGPPLTDVVVIAPPTAGSGWDAVAEAQEDGVVRLFRLVKALLAHGFGERPLRWTVVTRQAHRVGALDRVDPAHAGLHGLAGSMAREYPEWEVRRVDLPAGDGPPWPELARLPRGAGSDVLAWRAGEWRRRVLAPLDGLAPPPATGYRHGGVYVVVGGAGGLGRVWTEYVLRGYGAQVVWVGRRPLDADIEEGVRRLARLGPAPVYLRADATDEDQLRRAREQAEALFGPVHGVVVAALDLLDQGLAGMAEERFRAGYAAKAAVAARTAQVFAGADLDFLLFFSSVVSFTTSAGQANYAAGSVFQDAVARRLGAEWRCPVKTVNWGYWGDTGVVATLGYRERMARQGIGSVDHDEAMAALELLLAGPFDQLAMVRADPRALPGLDTAQTVRLAADEDAPTAPATLPHVLAELRELVRDEGGVSVGPDEDRSELRRLGLDPGALSALAARVGTRFRRNVPQSVFVDHPTLHDLACSLLQPPPAPAGRHTLGERW